MKKFVGLILVAYVVELGYAQTNLTQNELDELQRANDTIIELFNNCKCIPYFSCSYANNYVFATRLNIIPQEKLCSQPDFVCCTDVTPAGVVNTTNSTTTPKANVETNTTSSTTETPPENTTLRAIVRHTDTTLACGLPKTQIGVRILTPDVESAATIPGEVPWMVEIFQKRNNAQIPYKFKCPGTLIHAKVVLTATHCVASNVKNPQTLRVVATGQELFQNIGVKTEDERNVVKVIKHPKYYSGGLHNDISLLILEKEYSFSDNFLNPVCLPKANQTFDGRRCIAAGWGKNSDLENVPLHKVDVPIVNFQQCENYLKKARSDPGYTLHSSFICAGGEEGKDTCKGDGGGPLMCLGAEYEYVQVGIVSWGPNGKCGIFEQPGVYADVSKFSEWITSELVKEGITLS